MHTTSTEVQETRSEDGKGFTMSHWLVVVVVLGVLIGIAVPMYLNSRKSAKDATESDLQRAMSVLEVCYTDNGVYPASIATATGGPSGTPVPACAGQTINLSTGITQTYFVKGGGYVISNTNASETSGKYYCYDSTAGGDIKVRTTAGSAAGC